MQQVGVIAVLAFVACALTGCSANSDSTTTATTPALASKNIVQLAEATPALATLVKALVAADLTGTLSAVWPFFTVFAPTNAAFLKLPAGTLEHLLEKDNKGQLTALLLDHVVNGLIPAANLKNGETLETLGVDDVKVRIAGGKVMINDATVTTADVMASNGVVHIIDTVLLPPVLTSKNIVQLAEATPALSTLVKAVVAADLAGTLSGVGPFTVFAPTNDAFDKLPAGTLEHLLEPDNKGQLTGILTYHVVSGKVLAANLENGEKVTTVQGGDVEVHIAGGKVMINDAEVTTADVMASNGVVHVIDTVLMPPVLASKNIVQLAEATPALSTLVEAVVAAGLVGTLSGVGPFTVFAPTNDAFDKLPAGTLKHLLEPKHKTELAGILTYHVVSGKVLAADLKNGETVKTVQGKDLKVHIAGGKVMINDAEVTTADVMASNGVVHIINGVLSLPKASEVYMVV